MRQRQAVADTVLEIGNRNNPGAWDAHFAGNLFSGPGANCSPIQSIDPL